MRIKESTMKKNSIFGVIALTMMLLASCTEQKMKQFAEEFATAVTNDDTTSIAKMYPDAQGEREFSIEFNKDSLSVEENADTFVVSLGAGKSLSIVKGEDDKLRIADSHGVISYPQVLVDFALKTGWIMENMSDQKIARQFSDTTFINYLAYKFIEQLKTKFAVKEVKDKNSWFEWQKMEVIVANESEYEIPGSYYEVVSIWYNKQYVNEGKDIKPGERKGFYVTVPWGEGTLYSNIRFKISYIELLTRYYKPQGNEYEAYMKSPVSNHP